MKVYLLNKILQICLNVITIMGNTPAKPLKRSRFMLKSCGFSLFSASDIFFLTPNLRSSARGR